MRMTYEHQVWLLKLVDELKLHPRVAKIRARSAKQEWEILDSMVSAELKRLRDEKRAKKAP